MIALAFLVGLLALFIAAWRFGDTPERIVATSYVAAAIVTELLRSEMPARYRDLETGVLLTDALLLAVLLAVSLRYSLWWPLCASALQFVTVLGHVAKLLKPEIWPLAYAWMIQSSSFPSLIVLAIGIRTAHRRAPPTRRSSS